MKAILDKVTALESELNLLNAGLNIMKQDLKKHEINLYESVYEKRQGIQLNIEILEEKISDTKERIGDIETIFENLKSELEIE